MWRGVGISYREIIDCRYIGLFSVSKSISYRTSHIEYLNILKTSDFVVFFRRKFSENSENSENPWTKVLNNNNNNNAENSENLPKLRRKLLKKRVFFEALILYRYRIVSRKKTLISYRYRIESKKSLLPRGGCDPGVWRCLLKTCWGRYYCWC